jgi:hypothetical protein
MLFVVGLGAHTWGKPPMADIQRITDTHFRLSEVPRIGGFAADTIPAGATGSMIARCFMHSGDAGFYRILEGLFDVYLGKYFPVDHVSQFLIVIHANMTADVYMNDIPCMLKVRAKRAIAAFEAVSSKDLADIEELRFINIDIRQDDRLVYCFKRNWRFGLYFDLDPSHERAFDVSELFQNLGRYFRYLSFYDEYATLEDNELFERLFTDGWFPFMELMGGDFDKLSVAYRYSDSAPGLYSDFVKRFDTDRVSAIAARWWDFGVFEAKRPILQAGVDAYLSATDSGYINCIKTLQSEIDGILRLEYFKEERREPSFNDLVKYIHKKAVAKFKQRTHLAFRSCFIAIWTRSF